MLLLGSHIMYLNYSTHYVVSRGIIMAKNFIGI